MDIEGTRTFRREFVRTLIRETRMRTVRDSTLRRPFFNFGFLMSGLLLTIPTGADEPTNTNPNAVRRYDPLSQSLQPIADENITPGKIYNHFSTAHNRYVWAYALPGGKWSYPLGPGTTELPEHFDLVTPPEITRALLEQRAGEWLARSRHEGSPILARLAADDHWELLEIRSVRSHFNLNSGYRWEWHGDHRIGVLHTYGRRWRYLDGVYQPVK